MKVFWLLAATARAWVFYPGQVDIPNRFAWSQPVVSGLPPSVRTRHTAIHGAPGFALTEYDGVGGHSYVNVSVGRRAAGARFFVCERFGYLCGLGGWGTRCNVW